MLKDTCTSNTFMSYVEDGIYNGPPICTDDLNLCQLDNYQDLRDLGTLVATQGSLQTTGNKFLESLGNLRTVGSDLLASRCSKLAKADHLEEVKGDMFLTEDVSLKKLPLLHTVGSWLVTNKSGVADLPALKDAERIGMGLGMQISYGARDKIDCDVFDYGGIPFGTTVGEYRRKLGLVTSVSLTEVTKLLYNEEFKGYKDIIEARLKNGGPK